MAYMLDTNIVSDLIRNPNGKVAAQIAKVGERNIYISIIVAAELRYGATKKRSARLTAHLERILQGLDVLPFETPAEMAYADLRAQLEVAGKPIGANDMLIAAHAISLGYTIVTANEREFSRIDGLPLENWLR